MKGQRYKDTAEIQPETKVVLKSFTRGRPGDASSSVTGRGSGV
jgi:hypothetical protein